MCIPCSLDSGWPGEKGGRKPGSPRTSSLGELREDGGVGLETGMRKCMPDPRETGPGTGMAPWTGSAIAGSHGGSGCNQREETLRADLSGPRSAELGPLGVPS